MICMISEEGDGVANHSGLSGSTADGRSALLDSRRASVMDGGADRSTESQGLSLHHRWRSRRGVSVFSFDQFLFARDDQLLGYSPGRFFNDCAAFDGWFGFFPAKVSKNHPNFRICLFTFVFTGGDSLGI